MEAIRLGMMVVTLTNYICVHVCSALEIERVLLEHSSVSECAVIGRQDDDLGQKIVAIVVPKTTSKLVSPCHISIICYNEIRL